MAAPTDHRQTPALPRHRGTAPPLPRADPAVKGCRQTSAPRGKPLDPEVSTGHRLTLPLHKRRQLSPNPRTAHSAVTGSRLSGRPPKPGPPRPPFRQARRQKRGRLPPLAGPARRPPPSPRPRPARTPPPLPLVWLEPPPPDQARSRRPVPREVPPPRPRQARNPAGRWVTSPFPPRKPRERGRPAQPPADSSPACRPSTGLIGISWPTSMRWRCIRTTAGDAICGDSSARSWTSCSGCPRPIPGCPPR